MAGKKVQVLQAGKHTRFTAEIQPKNRGRKPGVPNASTRLRQFLELTHDAKNPITGMTEELSVAEQMDLKQIAKALDGDLAAYREIMDRLEGRPKQPTEFINNEPMKVLSPSPEAIDRLFAAIEGLEDN
jgi:hypothetical protein